VTLPVDGLEVGGHDLGAPAGAPRGGIHSVEHVPAAAGQGGQPAGPVENAERPGLIDGSHTCRRVTGHGGVSSTVVDTEAAVGEGGTVDSSAGVLGCPTSTTPVMMMAPGPSAAVEATWKYSVRVGRAGADHAPGPKPDPQESEDPPSLIGSHVDAERRAAATAASAEEPLANAARVPPRTANARAATRTRRGRR
jgi:hypothetical protein